MSIKNWELLENLPSKFGNRPQPEKNTPRAIMKKPLYSKGSQKYLSVRCLIMTQTICD